MIQIFARRRLTRRAFSVQVFYALLALNTFVANEIGGTCRHAVHVRIERQAFSVLVGENTRVSAAQVYAKVGEDVFIAISLAVLTFCLDVEIGDSATVEAIVGGCVADGDILAIVNYFAEFYVLLSLYDKGAVLIVDVPAATVHASRAVCKHAHVLAVQHTEALVDKRLTTIHTPLAAKYHQFARLRKTAFVRVLKSRRTVCAYSAFVDKIWTASNALVAKLFRKLRQVIFEELNRLVAKRAHHADVSRVAVEGEPRANGRARHEILTDLDVQKLAARNAVLPLVDGDADKRTGF